MQSFRSYPGTLEQFKKKNTEQTLLLIRKKWIWEKSFFFLEEKKCNFDTFLLPIRLLIDHWCTFNLG